MTTPLAIRAFQTCRQYTAKGQRIAYAEISRTMDEWGGVVEVVFVDVDRHIDGLLSFGLFGAALSNDAVLRAYDHGGYGYSPDRALLAQLKAAAEAL